MKQKSKIPRYFVYGEPERRLDPGFVHVELISARKNLHRGKVEAHSHPYMSQLTCWTKGGGTYAIEDKSWIFSAPAICWLPSGTVHGFSVHEKSDAIVLSVADHALPPPLAQQPWFAPLKTNNPDWRELLNLLAVGQRQHAAQDQEALLAVAGLVLHFASKLSGAGVALNKSKNLGQLLKAEIDAHFRSNRKIADYITSTNSTPHLLDKAAQDLFGTSVKQAILQRRMLEAKRLLKFTIRSAEDIAIELGFQDPAYFNRAFKRSEGLSPIAWRKREV